MKAMSYLLKKQVLLNEVSAMFEKPCQHFLKCAAVNRRQAGSTKTQVNQIVAQWLSGC